MNRQCLAALVLLGRLASAGEPAPAAPAAPKPKQPMKLNEHMLAPLEREAGICGVIVVAKAVEAGEVGDDKERPGLPNENPMWGFGGNEMGLKAQRVRFEVKEVLRGPKELAAPAALAVMVRHFDFNSARQRLFEADRKGRFKPEDIVKDAAVKPGEEYLLLLAEDPNLPAEAGGKEPAYSTLRLPLFGPPPEAAEALRKLASRIRAYGAPPALAGAQQQAADAGLKALGSADWAERQKAHKALAALGPAVMALLEEARGKTGDLEVRLRCAAILDEIKPLPGGRPEDWAGDYAIKKIEKKPEEEKPEDEAGDAQDAGDAKARKPSGAAGKGVAGAAGGKAE